MLKSEVQFALKLLTTRGLNLLCFHFKIIDVRPTAWGAQEKQLDHESLISQCIKAAHTKKYQINVETTVWSTQKSQTGKGEK